MIDRLLAKLARHAMPVLAIGIFAGLALPALSSLLAPLLAPAVFVLLSIAFYRLDWRAVAAYGRRPIFAMFLLAWLLFGGALFAWAATRALGLPPTLAAAIVLMATAPPIISSVPFAQLLRLDPPLAAIGVVIGTLLAPITIPLLALELLGLELRVSMGDLMARLAILVAGALLAGALLRRWRPSYIEPATIVRLDGINVLIMLVFAIAIMDGVTDVLVADPGHVLIFVLAAFVANLTLQAASAGLFAVAGARPALTVGLISGNRNMALIMAALAGVEAFDLILFFAVGQIPIYMLPALLAPIYRRILARWHDVAAERTP